MTWLKKLSAIALILCLTGCAGVDIGGLITATWDAIGQSHPTPPVVPPPVQPPPDEPVPPKPPTDPGDAQIGGSLILFDLPQTAVDMYQAGFPCREGVCLYALGQVANGWPIPAQSDELALMATYYDRIGLWYEDKVRLHSGLLKNNPSLTVTILANDAKDRFGCRIGPATMERLKEFGDRVQMGYFVSESEY